jgi:dTDP-glucose pyrophosphorylase
MHLESEKMAIVPKISANQLQHLAEDLSKSSYGHYLLKLLM